MLLGKLDRVPPSFRKRGMLHFHRDPVNKRVYRDNLCFFRCLAYHLYNSCEKAVTLFNQAYPDCDSKTFKGIRLSDLDDLESLFKICVRVFSLSVSEKKKVKVVRSKVCGGRNVMNLNMYKNHLSLIVEMGKYGKVYKCDKCHTVFSSHYKHGSPE